MRSQWCREHIDETAENCGLGEATVSDVKKAAEFCVEFPEISDCSTHSIMTLIRCSDDSVRDNAISSIRKSLDSGKHPLTGKAIKTKRLSEKDIKKVLEKSELEVRGEIVKKIKREKKPPYNGTPQKDDFKSTERIELPKTLAQKLAVEDGDGFASTPTTHAPESPAFKLVLVSQDPIKQKRFMMDWHAEECVKLMSPTVQTMVMDILRENRSWKTADAIYFGIQVLAEQKKKR